MILSNFNHKKLYNTLCLTLSSLNIILSEVFVHALPQFVRHLKMVRFKQTEVSDSAFCESAPAN